MCRLTSGYPWHIKPISLRLALQPGVAHHREPLLTSHGKFLVEKTDAEVAVLEQDMAPLDLHLSTCKQDLKCVLVALFHNRIVHRSIKQLVIKNIKQKGSS